MTEKQFQKKMEKIKLRNKELEYRNQLKAEKNKVKRFGFKKMKTSNKVLITAIIANVLFSIACLFIQYKTGYEINDTLITLWFSFWTIEVGCLAGIKISKVIKLNNADGMDV